jgi:hypothetical protein
MKKRFALILAVVAIFGLSIAAMSYARSTNTTSASTTMSDCCKGDKDSCPMKKAGDHKMSGDHKMHGDKAGCCDNCDCSCCKEGAESCPMKAKKKADGAATDAIATDAATADAAAKDAKGCDCGCSCCGGKEKKEKKDSSV